MERARILTLRILEFSGYVFLAIILLPVIIACIPPILLDQRDHPSPRSIRRKEERTRRLAGKARWRHGATSKRQERQGRRAWEKLVATGDVTWPPSRPWSLARSLVWESWLQEPDDEGWAVLTRWRGKRALTDLLRIVGDRRDQGEWDALAAFCARHELAPEEPAERARFYLVTGQHERRRGLDPDGSRLGAAYWATSLCEGEREHMWKTLVTSEDLDGMRAVVNANSSRARVSAADRRHAIDLRGDLGDWGEVWRQAQSLRLLDATAAIAGIGPGWRPDSQSGTSLFVLLAAADLTSLRDARLALSRPRASTMNALRRLVNRPLAAWQPGDLGVALAAYRDMERYPAVRPLCELLVRCLECRYGDEVLIGADAQQPPTYQG